MEMKGRKVQYVFVLCMLCLLMYFFIGWIGSNPYHRLLEEDLLHHRPTYQAWLTARSIKEISGEKVVFEVDGQATDPACARGCSVDSIQVYRSEVDEWVVMRWLHGNKLRRVPVASRSSEGRRSTWLFLERNKGLLGVQVPVEGRVALYDIGYWLRNGKLRSGTCLSGSLATRSVVLQSSIIGEGTGGVPAPFGCYWEIGEDGQVLARGLYGS
ncbi:MAG: hypothetical protein KatS3mg023_0805 [Armatimonadota bacterium]|nr:MAG: hypothetical protein KatS3mg023_0805 [Armatimonadota bacterium]